MASLSTDGTGNRTVQFVGADGRRRSVRLGRVNKKQAESFRLRVEALVAASRSRLPLDTETAAWVGAVGDPLAAKLAGVGLIPPRRSETLAAFLTGFLDRQTLDKKPSTVQNMRYAVADLVAFFGPTLPLPAVTEAKAEAFRSHYLARPDPPAATTVQRRVKYARQFFKHAVKLKLVAANPFAEVAVSAPLSPDRRYYLSLADADRLLAVCPPQWRVIVGLARFGGLRCPTEVLSLRWEDVNFESGRMAVTVPKLEHIEGKGYRPVPLFPRLRATLDEAWELAQPGAEYVVGGNYRAATLKGRKWQSGNLRTSLARLVRRAGLAMWPRAFNTLRGSCETDLMQEFPSHVVCEWIGHSEDIARAHYLTVRDIDFERALSFNGPKAVQNPVQSGAATTSPERTSDHHRSAFVPVFPAQSLPVRSGPLASVLTPGRCSRPAGHGPSAPAPPPPVTPRRTAPDARRS